MNIKKITLCNFLSYRHAELDMSDDGVYNFIGATGAGKSAIREAITWCLFGKSRVQDVESLIHKKEDTMYVTIELTIGKKNYSVSRYKDRGQSAKLEINDGTETAV